MACCLVPPIRPVDQSIIYRIPLPSPYSHTQRVKVGIEPYHPTPIKNQSIFYRTPSPLPYLHILVLIIDGRLRVRVRGHEMTRVNRLVRHRCCCGCYACDGNINDFTFVLFLFVFQLRQVKTKHVTEHVSWTHRLINSITLDFTSFIFGRYCKPIPPPEPYIKTIECNYPNTVSQNSTQPVPASHIWRRNKDLGRKWSSQENRRKKILLPPPDPFSLQARTNYQLYDPPLAAAAAIAAPSISRCGRALPDGVR